MFVLKVIGVIVSLCLLFLLMFRLNIYTFNKYKYEFFTQTSFGIYMVIYCGIFFGYRSYENALRVNGDELNGILIIAIALLIFIAVLINNIKSTSFYFGIAFTTVQSLLYIPICIVGFFALLAAVAFFSQTKPVYRVN